MRQFIFGLILVAGEAFCRVEVSQVLLGGRLAPFSTSCLLVSFPSFGFRTLEFLSSPVAFLDFFLGGTFFCGLVHP